MFFILFYVTTSETFCLNGKNICILCAKTFFAHFVLDVATCRMKRKTRCIASITTISNRLGCVVSVWVRFVSRGRQIASADAATCLMSSSGARWRSLSVSGSVGPEVVVDDIWGVARVAPRDRVTCRAALVRSVWRHRPGAARAVYSPERTAAFRRALVRVDEARDETRRVVPSVRPTAVAAADSKPFCGRAIYWGP